MTSRKSITLSLIGAGLLAAGIAWVVTQHGGQIGAQPPSPPPAPARQQWTASAPGRVEPRGGEVRLSALVPGRVAEVAARVNDRVQAGDLLLRVDDDEARARMAAADAELAVRKRDRDAETVVRLAQDRRQAEDAVATAERNLLNQRLELDRLLRQQRNDAAGVTEDAVNAQRSAVATALDRVEQDRASLRRAQTANGVPVQSRLEAAVTAGRADAALAETLLERSRLRSPIDGTVLQVLVRVGEVASASPEQTLVVVGDLSRLRVRAELEERDVAKVRIGQPVVVRSDAFPGREFTGRVASLAQALAPARLPQRGPRRPTDQDTLEVLVDLDPGAPLLPGMRADVFFRAEATAQGSEAGGTAPATASTK